MNQSKLAELLLKASFTGTFAESMLIPIYAVFTAKVGGSILDAGLGYAIFAIMTGIVVTLCGRSKYFDEHKHFAIFLGFLISGIGDVLYLFIHTQFQLFLVQAIIGISVGVLNTAWDAVYSNEVNEDALKGWASWSGGISFIEGIAFLSGGFVVSHFGFTTLFILMGLIDCVALYFAYLVWRT